MSTEERTSQTRAMWVTRAGEGSLAEHVNQILEREQKERGAVYRDMKVLDHARLWLILDYPLESEE